VPPGSTCRAPSTGFLQRTPLRRLPRRCPLTRNRGSGRPEGATPPTRSAFVVSHHPDGFLHRRLRGLVASRCRPWGSPDFRLSERPRARVSSGFGVPAGVPPSRAFAPPRRPRVTATAVPPCRSPRSSRNAAPTSGPSSWGCVRVSAPPLPAALETDALLGFPPGRRRRRPRDAARAATSRSRRVGGAASRAVAWPGRESHGRSRRASLVPNESDGAGPRSADGRGRPEARGLRQPSATAEGPARAAPCTDRRHAPPPARAGRSPLLRAGTSGRILHPRARFREGSTPETRRTAQVPPDSPCVRRTGSGVGAPLPPGRTTASTGVPAPSTSGTPARRRRSGAVEPASRARHPLLRGRGRGRLLVRRARACAHSRRVPFPSPPSRGRERPRCEHRGGRATRLSLSCSVGSLAPLDSRIGSMRAGGGHGGSPAGPGRIGKPMPPRPSTPGTSAEGPRRRLREPTGSALRVFRSPGPAKRRFVRSSLESTPASESGST
jgi:hypothetical protein